MSRKRKLVVEKDREVTTYAEMWHTSYCLLKKGQDEPKVSFHQFMASLVFTAFTLEAYLNHIGAKIFSCWEDLERLSPREKLNVIAERLGVQVDYGKRPWQVMKNLFRFRNEIAHGKSIKVKTKNVLPLETVSDEQLHNFARTSWEKYCTKRNAERARKDSETIVETMHTAAGFENDHPFVSGFQIHSATVIEEQST